MALDKVDIVGTYPPPFGGVSIHIKSLAAFFRDRGVDCTVYNTGKTKNIERPGVVNVFSLFDLFRKLARSNADVIHVHGGSELYKKLIPFGLLRYILGKRFIITVHSGDVVSSLRQKGIFARMAIRWLFNSAAHVICVSDKLKHAFAELGIPDAKCSVIPAFSIDAVLDKPDHPKAVEDFIANHNPLLSCLGYSFGKHYGFSLAIAAIDALKRDFPGIGLIIMGADKKEEAYGDILDEFSSAALARVAFTGDLDHKAVLSVIKESRVFLRPTYHDGDAISVREAIAMRVPVIASDCEFRPAEAVLFKTGNVDSLVSKIRKSLESEHNVSQDESRVKDVRNLVRVCDICAEVI